MNHQAMVELFVRLAKPRLLELLRLKVPHFYDPAPGAGNSVTLVDGREIILKAHRTIQPYGQIERFVDEEKVMGYVVNPGLLSVAKAISLDVRGRQLLVTRRVGANSNDPAAVAHMDEFGLKVAMRFDEEKAETKVIWDCLYGVC